MHRRGLIRLAVFGAALATTRQWATAQQGETTMSPNPTIIVRKDVIVERTFDASPERVWQAFTTEADVRRWWGPEHFTAPVARMDVREGGTSLVCMRSPDGHDHWMTWDYTKVVPHSRLDYVQNLSDADGKRVDPAAMGMPPEFPRDVSTRVTLTPRGNKTEMRIVEDTTTSEFMHEMSKLGLEQCMDKMAKLFA